MKILGLKIWRDRLTDEQYVEQIRKGLRIHKWLRYLHAIIGIAIILLCVLAIDLFIKILSMPATPPQQQSLIYLVFVLAIIVGLTIGFWLMQAAQSIASAFFERRKDHMLVECWDALNEVTIDGQQDSK